MSRFKNEERVQVIATTSNYLHLFGTVAETDSASVRVMIDGLGRALRFWDNELIPAPSVPAPAKELTRTQAYIRELDENATLLREASLVCPVNSTLRKDLDAFAASQAKIVYNLKMLLNQDGVKLWETEDVKV